MVNMSKTGVIRDTSQYVMTRHENDYSGHDWWHIQRVRYLALKLAKIEGGDIFLIEMASLLHDLDDWKLKRCEHELKAAAWLKSLKIDKLLMNKILDIISQVSFKGAGVLNEAVSIEAKIVQDADRLDAIGAIGIARTFSYGGNKGRPIYEPDVKPLFHNSFDSYQKNGGPTINHFYEKLLLLKDRLNTVTAIEMAKKRHTFMELFLEQFFDEWNVLRE